MTCEFSALNGKISIDYHLNAKLPVAQFAMIWTTSEEQLLRSLLHKFLSERVLISGINIRNGIISGKVGKSGIMFFAPEQKFFNIINQIYNAIFTYQTKLDGDYKKLVNDVKKGCKIYITGKIRTLSKHLSDGKSSKIANIQKALSKLKVKDRYPGKLTPEPETFKLVAKYRKDGNTMNDVFDDQNKYDLSIFLSKTFVPFWFSGQNIYSDNMEEIVRTIKMSSPKIIDIIKYQASLTDQKSRDFLNLMFAKLYNFTPKGSDPKKSAQRIKALVIPKDI